MSGRGEGTGVDDEVRRAHAYLGAVSERPTAPLWDLVDAVGPVEAADRVRTGLVDDEVARQTVARRDRVDPAALLARASSVGARLLVPGDPDWPAAELADLDRPRMLGGDERAARDSALVPFGLWWRGPADPGRCLERSVAVVGTRAPTSYGRATTADLAGGLAGEGFTVVSGGAFGIDAAAHRSALASGGATVAVLACGVDVLYPRGNAGLLAEVAATGAVVSAHPPGTGVTRYRFLDRNRIIAALTPATVVVEAAARSGALSTARWAGAMGRPVGAVPGPVTSIASVGCHQLVRERGAVLVTRVADIVELAGRMGEASPAPRGESTGWDELDDVTRRVLEALPLGGGCTPAEVAASSGVPPGLTRAALGRLLAAGTVERGPSGWRRRDGRGHQLSLPVG